MGPSLERDNSNRRSRTGVMGKQVDPLGAQTRAARVEKARRAKKVRDTLPSWYYRVHNITWREDRDGYGADFDEDFSELEEDEEQESDGAEQMKEGEGECTCDDDASECDCG